MAAENKLRTALSAIDDAKRALKRIRDNEDPEVARNVKRSLRELDDAESEIERAIREIR